MTLKKRMNIKYSVTQIFYWTMFCAIYAFATSYLVWRGFNPSTIGIVLAVSNFLAIFTQPITAKLIQRYESITVSKSLRYNFYAIILLTLLLPYVFNYILLSIFVLIITSMLNTQSLMYTYIMEYINNGVDINFGLGRGIGSMSFAIFSALIGFVGDRFGFSFIPYLTVILSIIILLLLLSYDKVENIKTKKKIEKHRNFYEFLKKYDGILFIFISVVCLLFGHTIVNTFLLQITENIGGTNKTVGIALMLAAVTELPTMAFYPVLSKKFGDGKLFKWCSIAFTLKLLLTYLAFNVSVLYFAELLQIAGYAIYVPVSVFYINKIMEDDDKVVGQAYIMSFASVGGILGNLVGGYLIQRVGVSNTLLISILISTTAIFMMYNNVKRVKDI